MRSIFPVEKHWSRKLFPPWFGHWSLFGKFFLKIAGSGPDGSNDTGLKFVWCPGAQPVVWDTHTKYLLSVLPRGMLGV
jgi:hypothetical protein